MSSRVVVGVGFFFIVFGVAVIIVAPPLWSLVGLGLVLLGVLIVVRGIIHGEDTETPDRPERGGGWAPQPVQQAAAMPVSSPAPLPITSQNPVIIQVQPAPAPKVLMKCSHCGNIYDLTLGRCDRCGAPAT